MCARVRRVRRDLGTAWPMAAPFLAVLLAMPGILPAAKPDSSTAHDLQIGKSWFTHEWTPRDQRSRSGDGLGPVFNGRSCAECHNQGGHGGGGGLRHNVQLLSVQPSGRVKNASLEKQQSALKNVHPDLAEQPIVVLNRFGNSPQFAGWRRVRLSMVPEGFFKAPSEKLAAAEFTAEAPAPTALGLLAGNAAAKRGNLERAQSRTGTRKAAPLNQNRPFQLALDERNTTALFGNGLIDQIPDEAILARTINGAQALLDMRVDAKEIENLAPRTFTGRGIVGKASILSDGRVGKFGWKGQHATLSDFTSAACAVEVGLEVPGREQAGNPLKTSYCAPGYDMNRQDLGTLVAFISALPAPRVQRPEEVSIETISHGELMFEKVGCADCHVKNLGDVAGIYSDLLLHDMGGFGSSGSYGSRRSAQFARQGSNPAKQSEPTPTEWRTPPLWGLADSAPYMHDGRAATVEDAISEHRGTAHGVIQEYNKLSIQDKSAVLWFLGSLRAPTELQVEQALSDVKVAKN